MVTFACSDTSVDHGDSQPEYAVDAVWSERRRRRRRRHAGLWGVSEMQGGERDARREARDVSGFKAERACDTRTRARAPVRR